MSHDGDSQNGRLLKAIFSTVKSFSIKKSKRGDFFFTTTWNSISKILSQLLLVWVPLFCFIKYMCVNPRPTIPLASDAFPSDSDQKPISLYLCTISHAIRRLLNLWMCLLFLWLSQSIYTYWRGLTLNKDAKFKAFSLPLKFFPRQYIHGMCVQKA